MAMKISMKAACIGIEIGFDFNATRPPAKKKKKKKKQEKEEIGRASNGNGDQSIASSTFSAWGSCSETKIPTKHSPRIPSQFTHG